jgi:imidazolonepropionase-like amidohydrolase
VSFQGFVVSADSAAVPDSGLAYVDERLRGLWREQLAGFPPFPLPVWQALFDHTVALTTILHRAGADVLVGSDLGNPHVYPGSSVHEEMALLVRAGYRPAEALRAATDGPARYLGAADSLGSIVPGQVADLVLLDADPLADIRNTRRIAAVILRGRVLDRARLDSLLAAGRRR